MNKLFDPDGIFATYGMKLFNILFLNIIWFFLTVLSGGFLIGLSTVGMYKGVHAGIAPNNGFSPSYFFRPIKQFKTRWPILIFGSLLNFIVIGATGFAVYSILFGLWDMVYLMPIYLILFIESIIISFYSIPLIAHSQMEFKKVYFYSFGFANRHILVSLIGLLAVFAFGFILLYMPLQYSIFLFFVFPSLIFSGISYLVVYKVFPKYNLEAFQLEVEN